MARLMLLDAASMYFRAFHAVPGRAPDGTPIGAVRGFLDALARLLRAYPATRLVACMDADWRPAFRLAALPGYKAHRVGPGGGELVPPELEPQVAILREVLGATGIAVAECAGYEADDVIGTLAARAARAGELAVDVVSGDRDLFQLVDDSVPVRVLYTGGGGVAVVDEAEITARYGIPGRTYADFATLRGDPSDGLPGVAGIGAKTAAGILNRYRSLAAARAAATAGEFASAARLRGASDYLDRAEAVVAVARDAPLGQVDDRLPPGPADPARLLALCDRYGLDAACNRLAGALGWHFDPAGPALVAEFNS
ncbi:MAG: 5'-3' exonuclease [Mycobacteriales bacterium]